MRVHGSHTGVIQSSRNRIGLRNLSVGSLHQQGFASVNDSFFPKGRSRSTFTRIDAFSGGFYCDNIDTFIVEVMVVESSSIASSTYTGNDMVRIVAAFLLLQLPFCFLADDRLKTGDHIGIGMRAYHRANDIMGIYRIIDPIANGFVGGIFQGFTSRLCRTHSSS